MGSTIPASTPIPPTPDPYPLSVPYLMDSIRLEIFRCLFTSVAEEMGVSLRRASFSPNIKERRDYSCAVFDGDGRLIAQGDHMPSAPRFDADVCKRCDRKVRTEGGRCDHAQ